MATVVLQHIYKTYLGEGKHCRDKAAVSDVNLEIADGEFMVLVGPSGCGKSTTLRMIAGLEEISQGTISIDGQVVNQLPPQDRDIAMVFQNYALYPDKTVYENLAFCLKMRPPEVQVEHHLGCFAWLGNRWRKRKALNQEIRKRVLEAASILGIEELLERKPKQLSGGQRQRVALGRCIVRHPAVFLFDEPLSNLDAKMRIQMREEIIRLHQRLKATMIYVTHDQVEAMTMGQRICVMKEGVIQQVASPSELYEHPVNRFVAEFIGTPPMNMLPCQVAEDGRVMERGVNLVLPEYPNQKIYLGIRPEALTCVSDKGELSGTVEFAEPLGAMTYVHFLCGTVHCIAQMPPNCALKAGDAVQFAVDKYCVFYM